MSDLRISQLNEQTSINSTDKFALDQAAATVYVEYADLLSKIQTDMTVTESQISDLQAYLITISGLNISLLNNNSGFITSSGVTFENLNANSDVGSGSTQVAPGNHTHTGIYEAANANIQSHISSTSNPHSVTKAQVGLTNVTDNAQVKKISSSVDNEIMRWDSTGGDTPQGSGVTIDDNKYINGYAGLCQTLTAGESLSAGDVCYLKASDGKYWKAKADAESTSSTQLRLALASISADATGLFLALGEYTDSSLTLGPVYISAATAGARTTTAPSSSGNIVRCIGSNQSSTKFHFNGIDRTYLTLA